MYSGTCNYSSVQWDVNVHKCTVVCVYTSVKRNVYVHKCTVARVIIQVYSECVCTHMYSGMCMYTNI